MTSKSNSAKQEQERLRLARSGWTPEELASVLSDEEAEIRVECESAIRKGFAVWQEVGEAFLKIRDQRLYRSTHPTFEAYCREEWDMSRRNADRLISASEVAVNLRPIGLIPENEAQARELAPFAPDEQRLLVEVGKEIFGSRSPTASDYKSLGSVLREIKDTGVIDDGTGVHIPVAQATVQHIKAAVTEETYERMVRQSTHIAAKQDKKDQQERKRIDLIQKADLPDAAYRVIYADPPWQYGNTMPDYFTDQEDHYPLMTMAQICAMPVKGIVEDNAVLFLWVTSPILEESFQVVKAWGFQYKSSFIWDKIKHNMGHYNSVRHEILLICTRGSCQPDERKLFDSVQSIERTAHSEKPEEFRQIIDTVYPHGKRLELFARKQVEGWESFGNSIPERG